MARQWPLKADQKIIHVTRPNSKTFIDYVDELDIRDNGRVFDPETKEYLGRVTDSLPRDTKTGY